VTTELNELYQELILDHYRRPRNNHRLEHADHHAAGDNPLCGDHVSVFLKLDGNVVKEVTFEGSGCAISTASASIMTETLKGKTLDEAKTLFKQFHSLVTGESREVAISPGLGKLEVFSGVCQYPARVKCATLAWHTFAAALDDAGTAVSTE
jgi:nitrogen fixation protein NifU and related proteins